MKCLVFDTGTIITLVVNNLLWVLEPLKKRFKGEFLISRAVKYELIDKPMKSKKFKFEAMIVNECIKKGILNVYEKDLSAKTNRLLGIANKAFYTSDGYLNLVQLGEIEALALALEVEADAFLIDERTTRMMIESSESLLDLLNKKLHTKVSINKENLKLFLDEVKNIKVLRSAELMILAYEYGLLDKYISSYEDERELLDGLLWGVKLRGCSISVDEINEVLGLEGFKKTA